MSVLAFDFYAEDDPNGALLGTLDESDLIEMELRPALHELGSGLLVVSRHSTAATSTLIRENNIVKVRIPSVSEDPVWAFILKEGKFVLIDSQEQGGEHLTFGGPGLIYLLGQARLYHSSQVSDQPFRGSLDKPGMWTWIDEPYGAILTRIIEEGREAPFPSAAGAGSALENVTITFDRVNDSDGNPWPQITEEFTTPIGSDMLTVAERLSVAGDLYLVMDPDLTLHAYQTFGRDLTGAFASDNVRFEKGVNILTQLVRQIQARTPITHLLQQDSDGAYSTEVIPGYTTAQRKHWGYFEASQTNDDTQLNKIAQNVIAASLTSGQAHELEITPGFVPAGGRYMPGPEGTDAHFWLGDHVTLHTGSGEHDFNAAEQIVVAIRIVLDEAADDSTDDTAARSLHVVPELNYQEVRGFTGVSPAALGQPGYCCGPSAPTPPSAASCSRLYLSDTGAGGLTKDAAWEAESGTFSTEQLFASPQSTVSGFRSWDAVNAAAQQVALRQYRKVLNAAEAAALAAGGTFHFQARAAARHGIGIDEGAQNNTLAVVIRVYRPSTTTFTGTAAGMTAGGTPMPAQATYVNRMVSGALSAVSGTVAGDEIVLEVGTNHIGPTSGGTGAAFWATDTNASDLPEDEAESSDLNSWLEICTGGLGGDSTEPVVNPGEETPGTSNVFSPIDHSHAHGFLADDGVHQHDGDQLAIADTDDHFTATTVEGALAELADASSAGVSGGDTTLQHGGFIATYHRASDGRAMVMYSDDGLTFTDGALIELNTARRDPSLIHWDGTFWVVLTHGSTSLRLYSSPDLETWTGPTTITVDAGATESWAPEWIRNIDGTPYLHPSTGFPCATVNVSTDSETTFTIREIHPTNRAMTTWSSPVTITGTGLPTDAIDAFLLADGDDYWLWAHDESSQTILVMQGTALTSGYTVLESGDWAGWLANIDPAASGIEGPCLVRLEDGRWRIYFNENDGLDSIRAVYSETTDDWRTGTSTWTTQAEISTDVLMGHGSVTFIPGVYDHLRDPNAHADQLGAIPTALDDLSDVTITAAATGDMLRYDGSAWVDTSGYWALIVAGSAPPVAVTNEAADDFVYGWVPS